jgi:hypothetical protein
METVHNEKWLERVDYASQQFESRQCEILDQKEQDEIHRRWTEKIVKVQREAETTKLQNNNSKPHGSLQQKQKKCGNYKQYKRRRRVLIVQAPLQCGYYDRAEIFQLLNMGKYYRFKSNSNSKIFIKMKRSEFFKIQIRSGSGDLALHFLRSFWLVLDILEAK